MIKKIKYIVPALLLAFVACNKNEDEDLLLNNYDFMTIKGDSVISRDGLHMVASAVHIFNDSTPSLVTTQVTVGNNVFDVNFYVKGTVNGNYSVLTTDDRYKGTIRYQAMNDDSTFTITRYQFVAGTVNWKTESVDEVLFNVNLEAAKFNPADSTLGYPFVNMSGKIRAAVYNVAK